MILPPFYQLFHIYSARSYVYIPVQTPYHLVYAGYSDDLYPVHGSALRRVG